MNPYLVLHPSPEGFAGTILWAETWEEANDRADERFTGLNSAFWITEATAAMVTSLQRMTADAWIAITPPTEEANA